jgi:mono/diheme cytochrome c family protein
MKGREMLRPLTDFKLHTVVVAILLGLLLLSACGDQAIDPNTVGNPERGREIFMTGTDLVSTPCSSCHSLDGSQLEGENAGPSMLGISETAGTRVDGQNAVEYLRESIVDPGAHIVKGYRNNMEAGYKYLLSEDDIDNLVAFLLTQ